MICRFNSFKLMHTNELHMNQKKKKEGGPYNNEITLIVIHLYLRGYEFVCQLYGIFSIICMPLCTFYLFVCYKVLKYSGYWELNAYLTNNAYL